MYMSAECVVLRNKLGRLDGTIKEFLEKFSERHVYNSQLIKWIFQSLL